MCQAASRNKYGNSVLFPVCSRWEESAPWGWLSWTFTGVGTQDFLCFKVISYSGYSLSWNQMKPLSPQCFLSDSSFVPMFVFWNNHGYKAAVVSTGAYGLDRPAPFRYSVACVVLVGLIPLFLTIFQFHTSVLQASIPPLLPPSLGVETSEKSKLPVKPETSPEEKYATYGLTLWYKCSHE